MGDEEFTGNDNTKSEIFNTYFSSVFVKELDTDFEPLKSQSNTFPMEDLIIDANDIVKRLKILNINKSPGPDEIHPRILYEARSEIACALKIMFDISLQTHEVPFDWRAGNISPIFKKGSRCEASNYRPISLTSITCKLFESIIRDHIVH